MRLFLLNRDVRKIESIEALRFIAAIMVVLAHIPSVGIGVFGVDIFFIISGFIMLFSTDRDREKFLLKRCIRVLPIYYIFTLGVFLISLLYPNVLNTTTSNPVHLLKSLFFIPFDKNGGGCYPVLFLGWTLNYEMYFYSVFYLGLLINHKYRGLVCSLLLTVIYIICRRTTEAPFSFYGSTIVFEFILGMLLYETLIALNYKSISVMLLSQVFVFCLAGDIKSHRLFYYGYPSLFLCAVFLIGTQKVKMPSYLVALGGSSYSLYLSHPYIIKLIDKSTGSFSRGCYESMVATLLVMIIANGIAIVVYNTIEKPLTQSLRKHLV